MDTWGIDGWVFLSVYIGMAAAIGVAAVRLDRNAGEADAPPTTAEDLDDYEIAYLTGGARLAAVVALVNLERRGAIDLGDDLLRDLHASGDLDLEAVRDAGHLVDLGVELHVSLATDEVTRAAVAHPLEASALQAVRGTKPRTPWRVVSAVTRTKALRELRTGLERRGLLHGPADVDRIQARWRWLLPFLALGVLRVVAETGSGHPVAPLVVALVLTVVAMRRLARRRPANTRRGDRLVADLRSDGPELVDSPTGRPWSGLALALAGAGALWASDPALALAVEAPSAVDEASSHEGWWASARSRWEGFGHGGGWSGGAGCGGGGGDGGGGCGGGGGGCGGGGCGGGG